MAKVTIRHSKQLSEHELKQQLRQLRQIDIEESLQECIQELQQFEKRFEERFDALEKRLDTLALDLKPHTTHK